MPATTLLVGEICVMTEAVRPRALFVCVENSNRSQMAEAFARIHGGDVVEAWSAGSRPSGRVKPKAIEAMRKLGYDLTSHTSKPFERIAPSEYAAAVRMGCGYAYPNVAAQSFAKTGKSPTRASCRPRSFAK